MCIPSQPLSLCWGECVYHHSPCPYAGANVYTITSPVPMLGRMCIPSHPLSLCWGECVYHYSPWGWEGYILPAPSIVTGDCRGECFITSPQPLLCWGVFSQPLSLCWGVFSQPLSLCWGGILPAPVTMLGDYAGGGISTNRGSLHN